MDLAPYITRLQRELAVAVAALGDDERAVADRLIATIESAGRLALLNALSDAMDEISPELAPGSVAVRLRGLDPEFVVTAASAPGGATPPPSREAEPVHLPALPPAPAGEENGAARTSLRLPKALKSSAEEAARRQGISLNTWFVRAVANAIEPDGTGRRPSGTEPPAPGDGKSITGWAR